MVQTCKTFNNEREAKIFMLGFNLGGNLDGDPNANIDPEEPQTVLLDMTEDAEATFTQESRQLPQS